MLIEGLGLCEVYRNGNPDLADWAFLLELRYNWPYYIYDTRLPRPSLFCLETCQWNDSCLFFVLIYCWQLFCFSLNSIDVVHPQLYSHLMPVSKVHLNPQISPLQVKNLCKRCHILSIANSI